MRTLAVAIAVAVCGCGEPAAFRLAVVVDGAAARAARFAADDINAMGGVGGRPLELEFRSTASPTDPIAAIAIADSLVRDPSILAVVGHSNSAASLAAAKVYNEAGLPQIAPTTTAPAFSSAGPYSFRLVASDTLHARVLAEHARGLGHERAAVVYANDDYGRGFRESLLPRLEPDIDLLLDVPYLGEFGAERLHRIGRAVARSGATVLFWLGRPGALEATLGAIRARGARPLVLAGDPLDVRRVYARPAAFRGLRFLRWVDLTERAPALDSLHRRVARSGEDLTSEAVLAYDAVTLLADAGRAGAVVRESLRTALAEVGRARPSFAGLGGPVRFDAAGDALRIPAIAVVTPDGVRGPPAPEDVGQ